MDALLSKLTNLSYEIFGILLPGAVAALAFTILWIAAGTIVPTLSHQIIPSLSFDTAEATLDRLLDRSLVVSLTTVLALAYFVGHLLTWIARGGKSYDTVSNLIHLRDTLFLLPPKRNVSYSSNLEELFQSAKDRLLKNQSHLGWAAFFPVAKMYLMQKASYSLVASYQNKYTLHRALAVIAAITTWGCLAIIVIGAIMLKQGSTCAPNWLTTVSLLAFSVVGVWGFSSSYLFYWGLWGNYLITETYALLREEKIDESANEKLGKSNSR